MQTLFRAVGVNAEFHTSERNIQDQIKLANDKRIPYTIIVMNNKVYQEAELWYADVNARVVRKHWNTTVLPWYAVIYGWIAQRFVPFNENVISKK